jgi:hypothetical protein
MFRLGGAIAEQGRGSRLLLGGHIIGRDTPWLGGQRRTFLDETIEQGSLLLSHPEIDASALTDPDNPIDWSSWCSPVPDKEADYAIAAIRMSPDENGGFQPLSVSLYRRAPAVGVQPLGAVLGGEGPVTLFSVSTWAKLIASASIQNALVVIAGLLTLLSAMFAALQARSKLRSPSKPTREEEPT